MDRFYKLFAGLRIALCARIAAVALAAAAGGAVSAPAAHAAPESLFTVSEVKVDVTAADALKAREQAFAEAQQAAFQRLAEQILADGELAGFAMPDIPVISAMIQDFEITEEHLSSVRYVGTYTFRFDGGKVQSYFNKKGVTYSDVKSRPVLILPFYREGARSVLWGPDNPWLQAWARGETVRGLVPVAVPIGDVLDVADIGDDDALSHDAAALASMLSRYHAASAVIAIATPEGAGLTPAGLPVGGLTVTVYRAAAGGPQLHETLHIPPDAADADALFDGAVRQVRRTLQQDWKSRTAVNPAAENNNSLKARVRFGTMQEWIETQKALRAVAGVRDVKLVSLRAGEAQIELAFSGGEDRLRLALAQAGITLTAPQLDFGSQAAYGYGAAGQLLSYDLYLNKFAPGGGAPY